MIEPLGSIHIELFHSDNSTYGTEWNGLRRYDDYHRLYFIAAGSAEVVYNGKPRQLTAGHTYLFPTTRSFRYSCTEHLSLLNVCFKMTLQDGLDALELQPWIVELPASDINATHAAMTHIDAMLDEQSFANQIAIRAEILQLLAPHFRTRETDQARKHRRDVQRFAPVLHHIGEHIRTGIKIADLPPLAHMSRSYFAKKFLATFDMTPQDYIRKQRVELVKRELRHTQYPLANLAEDYGFSSPSHMTREFKHHTGYTPKDFRALDRFYD